MSIIRRGQYGGRYEPPRGHIWDPSFDDPEFRTGPTTTYMGFPITEPSPIHAQIEWKDSPEAHVYEAHLPGLRHDEVKVEVEEEERVLCITGEKKVAREERKGMWHQIERSAGRFVQRLRLPENAKVSHIKAYMDNGVLTVTVPKYEVANYHQARRPRVINISGN